MLGITDDAELASFVLHTENAYGSHPATLRAAGDARERLAEAGWTRHGYVDDTYCPPGMFYDAHEGICEPDDPRVMAGDWRCSCGYTTDRLVHADGHIRAAERGANLGHPGPHVMTEVARYGPRNREWGE